MALRLILDVGVMRLGMMRSVLNGKNKRGMVSLMSPPNSVISKNWSLVFEASFEAPIEPINENSRVSAPLKTFRALSPVLKASPIVWMLL